MASRLAGGVLAFDRLDERLPFPIPDEARAVLPLFPTILDLSQYTLKVTGLKANQYTLKINGIPAATLSAKQLETGVNLTALAPSPQASSVNPIVAQGRAILGAVAAKEALVSQWRSLVAKGPCRRRRSGIERATGGPDDEGRRGRRRHPGCRSAAKAAFRARSSSVISNLRTKPPAYDPQFPSAYNDHWSDLLALLALDMAQQSVPRRNRLQ